MDVHCCTHVQFQGKVVDYGRGYWGVRSRASFAEDKYCSRHWAYTPHRFRGEHKPRGGALAHVWGVGGAGVDRVWRGVRVAARGLV